MTATDHYNTDTVGGDIGQHATRCSESSGLCTTGTYGLSMTTDPSVVRSVAVSAEDLVAAMEAEASGDATAVLRVTPPFSGRMRARLHVVQGDEDDETVHIPPTALLDDDAPAYPTPDGTADELRRAGDETYSVDRHREYHRQRVEGWRDRLLDHAVDTTSLSAVDGEISIAILGP